MALGLGQILNTYIQEPNETHHSIIWQAYVHYLIIGGLPEAVQYYMDHFKTEIQSEIFEQISNIHADIVMGYRSDMAKHSGKENSMVLNRVFLDCAEKIGQDRSEKFIFKNI